MTNASPVFDALGDPTRRDIFERIAKKPRSVTELAGELPVSRPAVSQHLQVLARAGLVRCTAVGTRRIYEAHPPGLRALRAWLDRFWDEALASFKQAAEAAAKEQHGKR